jgi:hypothetical protein
MLQLHAQLPLIVALRCAAAMLLACIARRTGTLVGRSLNGLRLHHRACSGAFLRAALPIICTLGCPFLVPLSGAEIAMPGLPSLVEVWSSKRTAHVAVSERDWQLESAAQSLSNREQIGPQVHSRRVKVRSECSGPLTLSDSNYQPSALTSRIFRAIVRE